MMTEFFFPAPLQAAASEGWDPDLEEREPKKTLFDSSRGEIGLIVSIFKLLGTPTKDTWPVCSFYLHSHDLLLNAVGI